MTTRHEDSSLKPHSRQRDSVASSNASAVGIKSKASRGNIPASYLRKDHPKFKSMTGQKNNADYCEDPKLRISSEVVSPGLFVGLATPYGAIDGTVPTAKQNNSIKTPVATGK